MAWNSKVSLGDVIGSSNHNDMIRVVEDISGSHYGHSSNTQIHKKTNYGWATVADGGTISHNLGVKPSYVNVVPSGNSINYGIVWIADDTNINVSFTVAGSKDVNWIAEV